MEVEKGHHGKGGCEVAGLEAATPESGFEPLRLRLVEGGRQANAEPGKEVRQGQERIPEAVHAEVGPNSAALARNLPDEAGRRHAAQVPTAFRC